MSEVIERGTLEPERNLRSVWKLGNSALWTLLSGKLGHKLE